MHELLSCSKCVLGQALPYTGFLGAALGEQFPQTSNTLAAIFALIILPDRLCIK